MNENLQQFLSKLQPTLSLNRLQPMLLLLIPELNLMQRANCKPIASRSQALFLAFRIQPQADRKHQRRQRQGPAEMCGKQLRRKDLQRHLLLAQMHKASASISRPPTTIPQVLYKKGMTGTVSSKIGAFSSKIGAVGSKIEAIENG